MNASKADQMTISMTIEESAKALLQEMKLSEKIGQMCQLNASEGYAPDYLASDLQSGRIGRYL